MGEVRPAQWPAVRVRVIACALACGTTVARANRVLAWGRGPWPSMGDHIKCFCAPESSLVVRLAGWPMAG